MKDVVLATKPLLSEHAVVGPLPPAKPSFFKRYGLPALAIAALSLGVMAYMNGPWIMAELRYRFGHHDHKIAVLGTSTGTPSSTTPPAPKPELLPDPSATAEIWIPAINVKAPIVFDEPSRVEWKVQLALRRGVFHYPDTANPSDPAGNVVIFGHSSGQTWAPGDYKWIFTMLDKLKAGDQVQISYQGIPYIYEMTDSVIVEPTELSVLNPTDWPTLTLITCSPVGSDTHRLVVHAKLVQIGL